MPWEERIEEAHERKRAKYQPLMENGRNGTFLLRLAVGALRDSRSGGPTVHLASQG